MTGDLPFPPMDANVRFLLSLEQECLTTVLGSRRGPPDAAIQALFTEICQQAPWVPAPGGFFNAYGRVYLDCGHVELAAMECDCPYLLAQIVEQQQMLVAEAVAILQSRGIHLLLANNNHSGLLSAASPTWGTHENYLVERHPRTFGPEILPFLVTRVFGGAGGVHSPTGSFLAAVRPVFMTRATGGGTTCDRAIHSTCRDEHHMGPEPSRYRYHLILGDGHRSLFNLALQFGATLLALKAIVFDPQLVSELGKCGLPLRNSWLYTLRRFNHLARAGRPLRVAAQALDVQRIYLAAAQRFAATLARPPAWIARLLQDWRETLDALERGDRAWLAMRLDAFAKYELYSACLEGLGHSWRDLKRKPELFAELALLDHSYHAFCDESSAFDRAEQQGLLAHRTHSRVPPGGEEEIFLPATTTRARARAQFIREHTGDESMLMNWSEVVDLGNGRARDLSDPFATGYGPWSPGRGERIQRLPRFRLRRPTAPGGPTENV